MNLRSLLFGLLLFLWTAFITVPFSFLLLLPRKILVRHLRVWAHGVMFLLRVVVKIDYRITNAEHLPKGPCLIITNHQSMWETIIFHILCDHPCYVMKRELLLIPFYGIHALKMGMIGIERNRPNEPRSVSRTKRNLRHLGEMVPRRIDEGCSVILFPEGTRVIPGKRVAYSASAYALYRDMSKRPAARQVPVVFAALNSGLFWKKGMFQKNPGTIRLQFLPEIPPGLSREEFDRELEKLRETAEALRLLGLKSPQGHIRTRASTFWSFA